MSYLSILIDNNKPNKITDNIDSYPDIYETYI
jgi:hypothetical protein